ncbi:elongation factor G [candidate division LCP-89 bacterium B3_LCP]|uniref:Elongation factor G n=1 Tax=candidate division LCP-89 bacterium B3_LCP TaxID=2012998 RepID=A0A532UZP9_UNCL8|nr:MAG: elongation factor G [candidate division LCP-89 bacterium B3_LCP]
MPRKDKINTVRNIGIMAHIDAGKTTTTERILYFAGKIHRMGEVHNGSTAMDWMAQERERGITITSAATTVYWNNHRINIIDTPGHVDFTAEVERSLRVLDGCIALFCAVGGVEPQSETVWRQADKYSTPRLAFINKMDRVGADYFGAIKNIREKLDTNPVPLQIPLGEGELFTGLIDLVRMKSVLYNDSSLGALWEESEIPDDLMPQAKEYRDKMLEAVSDYDDELMTLVLEEKPVPDKLINNAIRKATLDCKIVPVLCGSAFKNKGVQRLLDGVVNYLPDPTEVGDVKGINPKKDREETRKASDDEPLSAICFKLVSDPHVGKLSYFRVYSGTVKVGQTIYNPALKKRERIVKILQMFANKRVEIDEAYAGDIVAAVGLKKSRTGDTLCNEGYPIILEQMDFPDPVVSVAIEPRTKADQDKIFEALNRLSDEDPTFRVSTNEETGQMIISGMGELHLDILVDRLLREFKVTAKIGKPQVAYKETIRISSTAEGRFVRQSGGRGHYGHVKIEIEPGLPGSGYTFENRVVGGSVPKEYSRPVSQGIKEAMKNGVVAGYPVVDIKAALIDGSCHDVDSSELAFKIAGSMAFQEAARKADPVVLEPVMSLEVIVPDNYLGDVIGNLSSRHGKIQGINPKLKAQAVRAYVPLYEMFGYATALRSISQGRAIFNMEFDHYEEIPDNRFHKQSLGTAV